MPKVRGRGSGICRSFGEAPGPTAGPAQSRGAAPRPKRAMLVRCLRGARGESSRWCACEQLPADDLRASLEKRAGSWRERHAMLSPPRLYATGLHSSHAVCKVDHLGCRIEPPRSYEGEDRKEAVVDEKGGLENTEKGRVWRGARCGTASLRVVRAGNLAAGSSSEALPGAHGTQLTCMLD
ncbi:unnamed protein product [Prorocentrum cordatum]|uniref:Uncharacterized protein n=1 Tax=Prorocentrum cordatum TaxID=2364126 RepID=A0ABN9XJC8_9DINO|nr:unnamed protein product [Polarella glacialis]